MKGATFGSGALAIAVLMLAACSNGRGSLTDGSTPVGQEPPPTVPPPTEPPPPEPPPTQPPPTTPPPAPTVSSMAGYWTGRASAKDRSQDTVALINEAGDAQLMVLSSQDDRQFVLFGNVCCEATFDDDVAGRRFHDDRNQSASVKVTRDGNALSGEIQFRGDTYTLRLSAASDYTHALTLQELSGTYSRSSFFFTTLTLTIDADGRLTGSDSNGCVLNGNVAIADPGRNMVHMRVDMANCRNTHDSSRQWNGTYTGLGLLLRANGDQNADVFFHSMIGPTWLGPQSVAR